MLDEIALKSIMKTYTEITKNTIICMDMKNLVTPIYIIGLDFSSLLEYADFNDIMIFCKEKSDNKPMKDDILNAFYTLYTKNLFAYNMVLFMDSYGDQMALIAGPILSYPLKNETINKIIISNNLPLHKKHEFIELLNNLPLASSERINQLGKLLLALSKTDLGSWLTSKQEIRGRKIMEETQLKSSKDAIEIEFDENHAMYKFCALIMRKIEHGDVDGIRDIISDYTKLFISMDTIGDHNRALKNRCIIMFAIACHFAIQSNVSYERMINILWRAILELEKLKAVNDIIVHMTTTIEKFAHGVSALSDKGYSLHINRIFIYIKGHLSEKITLTKLAEHVQLNPIYLSSLFKKETNRSLSYYINLFRIEEGKRLLIYSNKTIQEIAYNLGYNYQTHFNAIFKKFEDMTPLEYRKKMGNLNFVDFID